MLRYTLRQLSYFVSAVDHGSIAAAAEALGVSQPSLSNGLAKLENQLRVQLLFRHHAQGVTLTSNGERLLADARRLLRGAGELQDLATSQGSAVAGELRLGSFSTLAPAFLPALVASFAAEYPEVSLKIDEARQDDLIEALRTGRHELALLYDVDLPGDLSVFPLATYQPYVLLPRGHRLAGPDPIPIAALKDEPMVLLDIAPSRQYFLGILRDHGIEPRVSHSSPSLELVRGLVGRRLGYSLLVTRPAGSIAYDGNRLVEMPLAETVEPGRICLAMNAQLEPTRLIGTFIDFCQAHFAQKPVTRD